MTISTVDLNGVNLRMIIRDNAPWFVLSDVVERFDVAAFENIERVVEEDFELISEQSLYILMLLGKSELSEKFRKWLLSDVLGTIRVHGKYPAE